MTIKKILLLLKITLIINIALTAVDKMNDNTIELKLQFKIPAVSEKQNVYILPKDKLSFTDKGNLLVLSRKYANIYWFDPKGQYIGTFLGKGEGPQELSYPQYITSLSDNRLIVLNDDKFIFYEIKKNSITEIERRTVPYSNIGDIEEWNRESLFVLTAYPLAQEFDGSKVGKFVHIYNIKNKKNVLDYFDGPVESSGSKSVDLRSEYGGGDIFYFDNQLFLTYNQPGYMYIFASDGTPLKKISTKFPFVKYNIPDVKRVEQDGNIIFQMNYAKTCQMNFLLKEKRLYVVSRIDHGKKDEPDYRFYLSPLDYKAGSFVSHLKIVTNGVDISKSEFRGANENSLILHDEDFIYFFSL
jgi:hypothetical protein